MNIYRIAILTIGLIFSAGQALACSCAPYPSAAAQAESAPLIFVGKPMASLDVSPAPPPIKRSVWQRLQFWKPAPEPDPYPITSLATTFQVTRVLKGEHIEQIIIHHLSHDSGTLCGVSFSEGVEQLILAYARADGTYGTSLCSSPQFPLSDFDAALAPASTPVPATPPAGDTLNFATDISAIYGTWGADEAQCNKPQGVYEAPFIIEENRFDQHETHCDLTFTDAERAGWMMTMDCSVEGDRQVITEWIAVLDGELVRGREEGNRQARFFMRCSR